MDAEEDYADAIVSYFLAKRGKGSAESSRDQVKIEKWEAEGVPRETVLACIDLAFERSVEPPKSVSACGRWLEKATRAASLGDEVGVAEMFGADAAGDGAAAVAVAAEATAQSECQSTLELQPEPDWIDVLEQFAKASASLPTGRAAHTLAEELREIVAEVGGIDDETRAALPGAWVELVLAELSGEDAEAVRAAALHDEAVRTLSKLASPELVAARVVDAQARAIAVRWAVPALVALVR
jgi:hypothetical protein